MSSWLTHAEALHVVLVVRVLLGFHAPSGLLTGQQPRQTQLWKKAKAAVPTVQHLCNIALGYGGEHKVSRNRIFGAILLFVTCARSSSAVGRAASSDCSMHCRVRRRDGDLPSRAGS